MAAADEHPVPDRHGTSLFLPRDAAPSTSPQP